MSEMPNDTESSLFNFYANGWSGCGMTSTAEIKIDNNSEIQYRSTGDGRNAQIYTIGYKISRNQNT